MNQLRTDRDTNILFDLYNYRALTIEQINKLHFNDRSNMSYTYLRLHMLRQAGLITSKPKVNHKGKKTAAVYMLATKGIQRLKELKLIEDKRINATDLHPDYSHMHYLLDANEIYTQLSGAWQVLDSRETKRRYHLNRGNMISGLLINSDSKEFGYYIIQQKPDERTLIKILKEIQIINIENILVFCKSQEAYSRFVNKLNELGITTAGTLGVLPYPYGITILKQIKSEHDIVNTITNHGKIIPIKSKHIFASYTLLMKNEELYVTNMLYNDQMALYSLYNYYGIDQYKREGKKVLIITWKGYEAEYKKVFARYPHIEIIAIDK